MGFKKVFFILLTIIILISSVIYMYGVNQRRLKYDKAIELFKNDDFNNARSLFEKDKEYLYSENYIQYIDLLNRYNNDEIRSSNSLRDSINEINFILSEAYGDEDLKQKIINLQIRLVMDIIQIFYQENDIISSFDFLQRYASGINNVNLRRFIEAVYAKECITTNKIPFVFKKKYELSDIIDNLKIIPDDYEGILDVEILKEKSDLISWAEEEIEKQAEEEKRAAEIAEKNRIEEEKIAEKNRIEEEKREKALKKSQGVSIGMTKQDVLDSSWGKPNSINKTTTKYGVDEQWVYSNHNYLYFEDGILTAIQN